MFDKKIAANVVSYQKALYKNKRFNFWLNEHKRMIHSAINCPCKKKLKKLYKKLTNGLIISDKI